MIRLLAGLLAAFFLFVHEAAAQGPMVVSSCGTLPQTYPPGATRQLVVDINGNLCTNVSSSSSGSAVTIADGADVAEGATTSTPYAGSGTTSVVGALKGAYSQLASLITSVNSAVPAGENHIGETGWNQAIVQVSVGTTATTVTAGKSIGGLVSQTGFVRVSAASGNPGTGGILQSAQLTFKDAIGSVPMWLYAFTSQPSASTCTDNTTFALANNDRDKLVPGTPIPISSWFASNTVAVGNYVNAALPYNLNSTTTMYFCLVTQGSAVVTTSTTGATISLGLLRN
jgi:hypothetical protein